jgi:Fe2+ transport system protein B
MLSFPKTISRERRGAVWVIASFAFCPCHLPLTLAFGAAVFSGTAIGAWWTGHPYIAGALVTALWIAGTWRGIHHLHAASAPACPVKPSPEAAKDVRSGS